MDNYMVQGGNAWDAQSFDGKFGSKGEQHRDEYFEKDDNGFYVLKDGYEQRYLGESGSKGGAEMVYSNDYDDFESPQDARYYGVFKTSEPRTVTETVYEDKPVPDTEDTALTVQSSDQVDAPINETQAAAQNFKDIYEITLTNELKDKAPDVLENKKTDIKQKDAYSLKLGSGLSLI